MSVQEILIVSADLSRSTGLEMSIYRLSQNAQVVLATTGLAALNRLRERVFDIILADIELPHMSGFELAMAANHDSPQSTVILMADRFDKSQGQAVAAYPPNVKSVLKRPVSIAQLWSIVQANRVEYLG
jgi:CheY-like chemotaxis protein